MFTFQMTIAGLQRKEVAGLIGGYFGTKPVYQGAPSFEYSVADNSGGKWRIDKTNAVSIQSVDNLAVFRTLEENEATAAGHAAVKISTEGHTGLTLRNLVNILVAKQHLIIKTMGVPGERLMDPEVVATINAAKLETVEDFLIAGGGDGSPGLAITSSDITFRWFAASLEPDVIQAYVHFALAVNRMALALKYTTPTEKQPDNEKYHFRCWLLRLGFIGENYKASRKVLLERLSGDGAFRTVEQTRKARKTVAAG